MVVVSALLIRVLRKRVKLRRLPRRSDARSVGRNVQEESICSGTAGVCEQYIWGL
jgi:hypothetical protein